MTGYEKGRTQFLRKEYLYKGWFGRRARRRCPHSRLAAIYGDEINRAGGYRLWCEQCGRCIDGDVQLAQERRTEEI